MPKLVDQPLATWAQPVRWRHPAAKALPRTYIWATLFSGSASRAARARADPTWRYREVNTGHMVMLSAPEELIALLLELLATPTVAASD